MPKGPQGQKRPADAIGLAVMVGKIATGEVEDTAAPSKADSKPQQAGGLARAEKLTAERRVEVARSAANSRWKKGRAAVSAETSKQSS